MEWYREVQFISAVPMPPELADEFGTTVNGMWAAPEPSSPEAVADGHQKGRRALFSVPMVALTPGVYEDPATAHLLDEVCRDVEGGPARCAWYYWEPKPVYSACIYSDVFRRYLLDRCKRGVDDGMDVVNLDEIMTSVGLMNRDPGGSGFCARCLERFRLQLRDDGDAEPAPADDDALRAAIRRDDRLYERYHYFHERAAFRMMVGFIEELRSHAAATNPAFAISANLAYLGSNVAALGALWGGLWGPHVDFVLMENDYRVERRGPHCLLPRGKFTAWYRLGSAFRGTPTWICPSIHVPRQLAGQDRRRYYELMFLEAYANGGRWGYFWWPGVDAQTRRLATAPDALKDRIRFIAAHHELYEQATSMNDLAVLYLDGPITRRPETHQKYLALAQALAEAGHQFDVLYGGDGELNADELDLGALRRYRAILVPEARDLGVAPADALERYARSGGDLVVFSASPLDHALARHEDGQVLFDFWRHYRQEDHERIAATVDAVTSSRIRASHPAVGVLRYVLGDRQVLHLLNYQYVAEDDGVVPVRDLRVRVPWGAAGAASCTLIRLDGDRAVPSRIEGDELVLEVPDLDLYAMLVLREDRI
jgi:hypothetical protein